MPSHQIPEDQGRDHARQETNEVDQDHKVDSRAEGEDHEQDHKAHGRVGKDLQHGAEHKKVPVHL